MSIQTITNTLAEADASLSDCLDMKTFTPRSIRAYMAADEAQSQTQGAIASFDVADDYRAYAAIKHAIGEVRVAIEFEAAARNSNAAALGCLLDALQALTIASVTR